MGERESEKERSKERGSSDGEGETELREQINMISKCILTESITRRYVALNVFVDVCDESKEASVERRRDRHRESTLH